MSDTDVQNVEVTQDRVEAQLENETGQEDGSSSSPSSRRGSNTEKENKINIDEEEYQSEECEEVNTKLKSSKSDNESVSEDEKEIEYVEAATPNSKSDKTSKLKSSKSENESVSAVGDKSLTEKSIKTKIKLSRDEHFFVTGLEKDNLIFQKDNLNNFYKVANLKDKTDPQIFEIIAQNDKSEQIKINLKNLHEYTTLRMIKFVLVNYQNKVYEVNIPINVNASFKRVSEDVCNVYNLSAYLIAVIFREKRLTNKELDEMKLHKDFNFYKDFFLLVQARPPSQYFKFDTGSTSRKRIEPKDTKKLFFFCFSDCLLSSMIFPLISGQSDEASVEYKIYEIQDTPNNYLDLKLKKKSNDKSDKYKLNSLFSQKLEDNEKFRVIASGSHKYSYTNLADINYNGDEEMKELAKSFEVFDLKKPIKIFSNRIYLVKTEFTMTGGSRSLRLNTYLKSKAFYSNGDKCHECHIFADKKNSDMMFGGFRFTEFNLFDA